MRLEERPTAESPAVSRRIMASSRPWLLIAAALLLAVLSTILWAKWRESRTRADQLQGELKQVYAEAETLRTQVMRAQQQIGQLERELRALSSRDGGAKPAAKPKGAASR